MDKPTGKRLLGRHRRAWEEKNIIGRKGTSINMIWIDSPQDRDCLRAIVNAALRLWIQSFMEFALDNHLVWDWWQRSIVRSWSRYLFVAVFPV